MNNQYSIQPIAVTAGSTTIATCDVIEIIIDYQLNATEMWASYIVKEKATNYSLPMGNVFFGESDLALWGTDDMYIVSQVANAAGVTLV